MVAFYNQGDQEIYDEGEHFIPQEQYRLNKFNNTVAPMPMDGTQQVTQEFGIPYTGAFTNAGGGGGGGPLNEYGINTSPGNMKEFHNQKVWDGSSWVNDTVEGFWDPNLNTYKTAEGKNIKHAGLFTGDPKKGDIEGEDFQFPSIAGGIIQWLKNKAQGATEKIGGAFTGGKDETITDVKDTITTDVKDTSGEYDRGSFTGQHPDTPTKSPEEGGWHPGVKDGGRIGFFQGALADTAEGQAMSPGTSATGEFRGGEGGQGDGGQGNTGGITQLVDTDLMRTDPNVEFNYSPNQLAQIQARLYNKNLLTEDNINLEGQVGGGNSLIDYGINFTDKGITGSNVGMGPFEAHIDPNKNIDLGYTGNIGGYDINARTNLQDAASLSASKNGWDIGLTHNPEGTNAMLNWSTQWGQPENYNTTSWRDENPNLIYGMEGQNLRYGGLAGLL